MSGPSMVLVGPRFYRAYVAEMAAAKASQRPDWWLIDRRKRKRIERRARERAKRELDAKS